ncbi:MAG: family 10 glycosylhydrolase [Ignavibacteriales bacterium]|nr:family 10 glycosylhydrolase [Ignavibacteriales bacterium]
MANLTKIRTLVYFIFLISIFTYASDKIPAVAREMRAVWVATVANIDWPSKPGLSVDEQKKEAIVIIDKVKKLNMNTIVLQVRPQADAIYKSELEPWSYYLTGEQGKAPEPFYDPLEFWIEESHARGLELHAWLNPYRANHPAMRSEISSKSIIKTKPNCVRKLGNNGYYWMDPALTEVQDHSYSVVMDIINRYAVDAIHFDDYFYPYTEYNDGKDFPDDESYKAYVDNGGNLSRGDWRREAVNKFIERVYNGIKKVKPLIKLGISPFGIYRPGYPESIGGSFDQYATLYADAKLWLNKGWMDYYAPQLYWSISRIQMSYPVLLNWWISENTKKRNLWPGLFIRPEVNSKEMSLEIVNQIMVARGMIPNEPGTMLFSMKSLLNRDSVTFKALIEGPFKYQALVPSFPWLDNIEPLSPTIKFEKKDAELILTWKANGDEKPFLYVLYFKIEGRWSYEIFSEKINIKVLNPEGKKISEIAISAVDKCGNESEKKILMIN